MDNDRSSEPSSDRKRVRSDSTFGCVSLCFPFPLSSIHSPSLDRELRNGRRASSQDNARRSNGSREKQPLLPLLSPSKFTPFSPYPNRFHLHFFFHPSLPPPSCGIASVFLSICTTLEENALYILDMPCSQRNNLLVLARMERTTEICQSNSYV